MNNITTSKREIVMYQADDAIRLENVDIESLIRTIRGQKVMVDFDLASSMEFKTNALTNR